MVSVREELCVRVSVYPVMSSDLMVIEAESVEAGLFASKKTSSVETGTDALLAPPDVADQLVGPVAFQLAEDPSPTQYRDSPAACATSTGFKTSLMIVESEYKPYVITERAAKAVTIRRAPWRVSRW